MGLLEWILLGPFHGNAFEALAAPCIKHGGTVHFFAAYLSKQIKFTTKYEM
jgi:hypothetical protein